MVDVFISYSRRDFEMVALIARKIESEGYAVWWDAELAPHQSYGEVITDKIAGAKAALVVWSADAAASEWVRAEADMARNQRKLIQTALGGVMPPLPFNQIQYAELGGWQGEDDHSGWRKVKRSLTDLCGPGGGAAAPITDRASPPIAPAPPPTPQPAPEPVVVSSKWPLFAGLAAVAIVLAAVGGVLLGRRASLPEPAASPAAAAAQPSPAPSADLGVAAGMDAGEVAVSAPADAALPPAAVPEAPAAAPAPAPAAVAASAVDDGGVPTLPNPADMTFPDSSRRLIAPHEIASMGPSTLKVARGEILARKGVRLRDPFLQEWFSKYAWYRPRFDRVQLNPIEQRNIALIRQAEAKYGQ